MKTPALLLPDPSLAPSSPSLLLAPSVSEVERALSAREKRAANPLFRLTWSLSALAPLLPFPFPKTSLPLPLLLLGAGSPLRPN